MSQGRRTNDRRRRVLYSAAADNSPSTVASRREQARLREARSPAATYGTRVHRQLRGRWFGLVPVRRRTLSVVVGAIVSIAIVLCMAHYMAVAWPSIANHSDIARPLRLDRPDSFGRWFVGMLMVGSAGASFLIYQLRRHRLDDFRGHYRLWRLVLIVMVLASLNSVVGLVDWSGALIEAAIGKRVALSGSDWIRIVVSLGAAILVLRLIAELHQSRAALVAMLAAATFLAIPEAAKWNVLEVQTIERWALVTSAPLLAFTSLFVSFGIYLRMLYRQVRRFDESDRLKDRFAHIRLRVFKRSELDCEAEDDQEPKRRWWHRKKRETVDEVDDVVDDRVPEPKSVAANETDQDITSEADQKSARKPKRRWFGLRAAKSSDEDQQDHDGAGKQAADQPAKKKKRRFSVRLNPSTDNEAKAEAEPAEQPDFTESEDPKPKRKFGLGGFRRQRAEVSAADEAPTKQQQAQTTSDQSSTDEDYIDPDEIDWDSLSKAERRRMRKLIKRQNRAA